MHPPARGAGTAGNRDDPEAGAAVAQVTRMPQKANKRAKAGYMISAVAELYKLHPQTLRLYERVGLLKPSRSQGNTRLYTDQDLERLDVIVNLAGIEIILNMREKMIEMEKQMGEFAQVVQQELSRVAARGNGMAPKHAIVRTPPRQVR
jgi:MerR family transcriptional regulator/heat shock protein HspR